MERTANHLLPSAIFDRAGALKRMGGDAGLFRDMVQFFLEDAPGLVQQVHDCLTARDYEEAGRAAHSLKGLAANFGAASTVGAADAVERPCMAGNGADLDQAALVLDREVRRLMEALQEG